MIPTETEFFLIAEAGILESQALLLCQSIRQFAGGYQYAPITVVSPRPDRRPSIDTQRKLAELQVDYLELDIASPCPDYGTSFRVLAAAYLERRAGPDVLIQLDSDTLFVAEPDFSLPGAVGAARPVDVKGMCTDGPGDPFDPYWLDLCRLCGVDYERLPWVTTTVDRKTVRASYNGGLVAARRSDGLFAKTEEFFLKLVRAGLKPWAGYGLNVKSGVGMVGLSGSEYWGSSQAALSLAFTDHGGPVRILTDAYNIPLHSFEHLPPRQTTPIHLHYHWLCSEGELSNNPMLDGRLTLPEPVAQWLKRNLPLSLPTPGNLELKNAAGA